VHRVQAAWREAVPAFRRQKRQVWKIKILPRIIRGLISEDNFLKQGIAGRFSVKFSGAVPMNSTEGDTRNSRAVCCRCPGAYRFFLPARDLPLVYPIVVRAPRRTPLFTAHESVYYPRGFFYFSVRFFLFSPRPLWFVRLNRVGGKLSFRTRFPGKIITWREKNYRQVLTIVSGYSLQQTGIPGG
jgi:hypothetical protein